MPPDKNKTSLWVAIIGALGVIFAAFAPVAINKLKTSEPASFTGRVLNSDGNGINAATVVVLSDSEKVMNVYTDSSGTFIFPIPPDAHSLKISIEAKGYVTSSREMNSKDTKAEFRLEASQPTSNTPQTSGANSISTGNITTHGSNSGVVVGNNNSNGTSEKR